MSDYIERMKAISTIRSYEFGHCPEYMQDWATKLKRAILQDIVDDVMEIPAADVVAVKHGRWVKEPKISKEYKWCDNCQYAFSRLHPDNYCPNCGAKMDGE